MTTKTESTSCQKIALNCHINASAEFCIKLLSSEFYGFDIESFAFEKEKKRLLLSFTGKSGIRLDLWLGAEPDWNLEELKTSIKTDEVKELSTDLCQKLEIEVEERKNDILLFHESSRIFIRICSQPAS